MVKRAQRSEVERQVEVKVGSVVLHGLFGLPEPRGIVMFAHRSGKGRLNPRNVAMARSFREAGLATFMIDLLRSEEAEVFHNIFDIKLLADRLLATAEWVAQQPETKGLRIGCLGTSTAAAAALQAAARDPGTVAAVVSRGGRPDLAKTFLPTVKAPTLLVVGENDPSAIEQNRKAYDQLACAKDLVIIPGASHLFEETGTFDQMSAQARAWFLRYLAQGAA